jgi:hypothetical protein
MKKILLPFLFIILMGCSNNESNIISATNVVVNTIDCIEYKTNIIYRTNFLSNYTYNIVEECTLLPITNEITQIRNIILESPIKAIVDEPIRVEVGIIYTKNFDMFDLYDIQIETNDISNKFYINLQSFDPNYSTIEVRSIIYDKNETGNKKTKIIYLVKFNKTGNRTLMVIIGKDKYGEPIIERKIKVNVTIKSWFEKFWTWLVGAIGGLSGIIATLILIIQNSKKLKIEIKSNEIEELKEEIEELKEEIKKD